MLSVAAHECEGTGVAGSQVVGGDEGDVGREDFCDLFVQQFVETRRVLCDGANGFATETERGVVVIASGMLDEQQGGGDFVVRTLTTDDVSIDEGLQVVVGVFVDVFR